MPPLLTNDAELPLQKIVTNRRFASGPGPDQWHVKVVDTSGRYLDWTGPWATEKQAVKRADSIVKRLTKEIKDGQISESNG